MHAVHRYYTVVVFLVLASLDNVAIQLMPPLYAPIAQNLGVTKAAVAAITAVTAIILAVSSVGWAYLGDRANRKWLLMAGTLVWGAGTLGSALAPNYVGLFAAQAFGAVGLGAVGSVGFSVVSDLISPGRRGTAMAFWGLSQGIGTLIGGLVGGLLGAGPVGSDNWRRPFVVITVVGFVATVAYLFTMDIRRGQSEPLLRNKEYDYRISRSDLPAIWGRRTNVWLVLQGVTAQLVFGSLQLLPLLFQTKAEALGFDQEAAIKIGSIYATIFQLGAALSIVGGLVGDRWQRRTPRGRALVASVGIFGGIPFYVVLLFVPLRLDIHRAQSGVTGAVLGSIVTEPLMAISFLAAIIGVALTSANSPNWFALITEVNPPEHRGTVYSLGNLANGIGRAAGNWLAARTVDGLARTLPPPMNAVVGLAAFQVFFIPTGVMYWLASRTSPKDIRDVTALLDQRARAS